MKVCILADTHGYLDPKIMPHLEGCCEIWHGGDFGGLEVAEGLRRLLPLRGVYGNIDGPEVRRQFPETLCFEFAGYRVAMIHIGGKPGKVPVLARKLIESYLPHIYICGHSHILRAGPDIKLNTFHINPGACGQQGFHQMKTLVRLDFEGGKTRLEVVELGPRGY
jgi:putative phosphoesterase